MLKRMLQVKTAEFGVVTFGDKITKNELDGYNYINEIIPIQRLTKNDLIEINNSIKPGQEEDENVDMVGGIIIGADKLISVNKGKKYNRIMLLITDCETKLSSTDGLEETIGTLKEEKIPIYAAVMGKITESSDIVKKENAKLIESIVNDTDGAFVEANTLIDCMHLLTGEPGLGSRSQVSKTVLNITKDICIPCCTWGRVMQYKLPSLKKKFTDNVGNLTDIKRETSYVDPKEQDQRLSYEELTHGFKYGKQFVPMGEAELSSIKIEGSKSISIIGFEKKEKIPRHYYVDATKVVQGLEGEDGPNIAFTALSKAMWESGDVALCRYVNRENEDPILVVLSPPPKPNGTLLMHRLPCCEDINDHIFPSLPTVSSSSANEIVSNLIDSMTIDLGSIKKRQIAPLNPIGLNFTADIVKRIVNNNSNDEDKTNYDTFNEIVGHYTNDNEKYNKFKSSLNQVKSTFQLETVSKAKPTELKKYWSEMEFKADGEGSNKRPRLDSSSDKNNNFDSNVMNVETETVIPTKIEIPTFDANNGTIEDFEKITEMIFKDTTLSNEIKNEKLEKLAITVMEMIEKMINKQTNAFYKRAIQMLKSYRNVSKSYELFNSFNTFMLKIKDTTINGKHRPFWDMVKNDNLSLISCIENSKSLVSEQMSKEGFYSEIVQNVETNVIAITNDDFLDAMD
jgi:hypothetical protein